MSRRNYQPLPLHRMNWSDLSEDQVAQALQPAISGPTAPSSPSAVLTGQRLKIITDDGPTLEYDFRTARDLTLSENGGPAIATGYGALPSRNLVLISHMIPGTQRGYNLVVDTHHGLATVFEVSFSEYAKQETAAAEAAKRAPQFRMGRRNREVMRQVWFGVVDDGRSKPAERHVWTNRLEGKGIHWTQDDGTELLEFYLSIISSNFNELTRTGGELTFCSPSDYVMIDDHQFIYSRIESEFSGAFTLQVIDLFNMTQKGVRLGLTEKDLLEYRLFTGNGKITGQIATFEVFGNNADTRGARRVYRPIETFEIMTDAEAREQAINNAHAFGDGAGSGSSNMGGYKSERVTKFAGRKMVVRTDNGGPALDYDFVDDKKLRWRYSGDADWREAWYEMYEPDEDLFFFAHFLDAEYPRSCAMVAFDMKNGLTTVVKGTTGTPYRNNETSVSHHFGTFQTAGGPTPPLYVRHGWTDEMVGECVTWNYQRGNPGLTSMHFYTTPQSYSWVIFNPDGSGGMQWSSPGWYSKLRDGVYIMAWIEEACNGTLGVICYNSRTMHDAGFGYHLGTRGLTLNVIGARARHAGRFNIQQYVGIQA
ncbi:MAG: MoaF N-terminal domain-containing protein [Nevskiaceae bacterium]|jgi:hypothetical protein|nr:MoaF N-terminal domain-containing protein [Nevskiaceae bacterium]